MKFDSRFEQRLYRGVLRNCEFRPNCIVYPVNIVRTYTPDFLFRGEQYNYYIEAKGRFRTREEANKYIYIRNALEGNNRLVFLFMKRNVYFPGARLRKDGTKLTQEQWCKKYEFKFYYEDTIKELV